MLLPLALLVAAVEALNAALVAALLGVFATGSAAAPIDLPLLGSQEVDLGAATSPVVLATGAFFVARAAAYLLQAYLQARVVHRAGARVSTRLLRSYLNLPYLDFRRRNSAEMLRNAYGAVGEIVGGVLVPAVAVVGEILIVLALLTVLVLSAPAAFLAVLGLLAPVLFLLQRGVQPRLVELGRRSQEMAHVSIATVQQSLGGYREIRLLGREEHFVRRYHESRQEHARTQYQRAPLVELPRVVIEVTLMLVLLGVMIHALADPAQREAVLASLGLFAYAALRALPSVNRIVANLNAIRFSSPAVDFIYTDLSLLDRATPQTRPDDRLRLTQSLRLKNVSFRYPDAEAPVLKDIDLDIRVGEFIGVAGTTGGGKSTLVDVILGLSEPSDGEILIDGVALPGRERSWQRSISLVPQAPFLIDDTIRRNIALALEDEEIDGSRVELAAEAARLREVIDALPQGLDTVVGERGIRLSGGQQQRVVIARALYEDPDVLVLDEGTSALDNVTERELMMELESMRGGRTLIAIAHRLSSLERCDRILVVDGGRIVADGNYSDLLGTSAVFRALSLGK